VKKPCPEPRRAGRLVLKSSNRNPLQYVDFGRTLSSKGAANLAGRVVG